MVKEMYGDAPEMAGRTDIIRRPGPDRANCPMLRGFPPGLVPILAYRQIHRRMGAKRPISPYPPKVPNHLAHGPKVCGAGGIVIPDAHGNLDHRDAESGARGQQLAVELESVRVQVRKDNARGSRTHSFEARLSVTLFDGK
jgi:hypothetical protein